MTCSCGAVLVRVVAVQLDTRAAVLRRGAYAADCAHEPLLLNVIGGNDRRRRRLLITFAAISGFAAVPELARYCFSL